MHLSPLLMIWVPLETKHIVLIFALYFGRIFFITASYHRYFAHRSYKMGPRMELTMAILGMTSMQKGVLWWAANHRLHHKHSDFPDDVHSPKQHGFWWAHMGWILSKRHLDTEWDAIRDFARSPALRWLNVYHWVPGLALGTLCGVAFGAPGVVAMLMSTVLVFHGTFTIKSLAHLIGRARYATADTSRNSLALALLTLGEGWHNNHHAYQSSCNQGFFWWEIDITYYLLRALEKLGLVRDLRMPPEHVLTRKLIGSGDLPSKPGISQRPNTG